MDTDGETGNAFAIPDLWKTSAFANFAEDAADPLESVIYSLDLERLSSSYIEATKEIDLQIPSLPLFSYESIEDVGTLETLSELSLTESLSIPEILPEENIWSFPKDDEEALSVKIKGWETYGETIEGPRTTNAGEGGPHIFDAIRDAQRTDETDDPSSGAGRGKESDPFLNCLIQLGLGRESLLCYYSEDIRSFCPRIIDDRTSGYSPEAFNHISESFIGHGNKTRSLQEFVRKIHASSETTSVMVALASSISDVLNKLQASLGDVSMPIRSISQLQSNFEISGSFLDCLSDLIPEIEALDTDENILSRLFKLVQESEPLTVSLRQLIWEIFVSASKPWLESVGNWLGLACKDTLGILQRDPPFARNVESPDLADDLNYDAMSAPTFIAEDQGKNMVEIGQGLRMIQTHQTGHPLVKPVKVRSADVPRLEWSSTWSDIERIQAKAKEYECNLQEAIKEFHKCGQTPFMYTPPEAIEQNESANPRLSQETAEAYIKASISNFERPIFEARPGRSVSQISSISQGDSPNLNSTVEAIPEPSISQLPSLSFSPILSAQARLVNQACLRLLFEQHALHSHFSLLHRYSLFGDGIFMFRLSHALFDPELPSAERLKSHSLSGISSLKLGYRDIWPPASSELRLALMGILTDSYLGTEFRDTQSMFREELPGGLSFSIRDMSENELQCCMNPDSIQALDFLKLQYKPPTPVDAVITQAALSKYDAIFKLLFRAVRMVFVINHLVSNTRRTSSFRTKTSTLIQAFKHQVYHFVSAVCGYFFDSVQSSWNILDCKLHDIEKSLHQDNSTESLSALRTFHERLLDRMMSTLLLRKSQAQIMNLLEEIFSLVLLFARRARNEVFPNEVGEQESYQGTKELYEMFKTKVRVFISLCRGLSERWGEGGASVQDSNTELSREEEMSEDRGSTIEQLLLKLEMSGFYAQIP